MKENFLKKISKRHLIKMCENLLNKEFKEKSINYLTNVLVKFSYSQLKQTYNTVKNLQ